MRENEVMVQRTINEFKELYSALLTYFEADIQKGRTTPIMRFMFTRFVTKLVAFRRRIKELLGYTGGESLEQITLLPEIAALPLQSYIPRDLAGETCSVTGETMLWARLPEDLKRRPVQVIESLPNYRRPSLVAWLDEHGISSHEILTIGDLMDLGFDPTRLKEMTIEGGAYIFERIQARQLSELERKKKLLEHLAVKIPGTKVRGARLLVNPPLLTIQDRGNAYVLRRKVSGIHWDEASEQLQGSPSLKDLNAAMKFDRLTSGTLQAARSLIEERFAVRKEDALDLLTYFVSWDLKTNRPKVMIDPSGTFLESVWLA
jgi:hypothetical protein